MKKALKIFTLFVLLCSITVSAIAAKVSLATAQTTAVNFFELTAKNTGRNSATLQYTKTEVDGTVDFYVFNISPKGFVIVAADDQVKPIIAYSLESNFMADTKGRGVQNWMDHAATHIYQGLQRHTIANAQISNQWASYLQGVKPVSAKSLNTPVAPLLTTTWDQEPYYNQLCPYNTNDQQRTLTGCAATAMAQIMKYWNYPAQGIGNYGYASTHGYGNQFANFAATTYNWSAMPDSINSNNINVATLMYHCGVAVAMNYGDDNQGGSGAFVLRSETASYKHSVEMALSTYFNYNANTLSGVRQANYSSNDWINLLEGELKAGRPVQYEGYDTLHGGHTWVCDGYDENDMMHMNWGWGGLDNGYYSVASLTADGYNFSNNEAALTGIEPTTDLAVYANATQVTICKGSSTLLTAQSTPGVNYTWAPATGLSCPTCSMTAASPDTTTTYTVTIDSAGFTASSQITIAVSNLHVNSTHVTNLTCYGAASGKASLNVGGGYPAYSYIWSNGASTAVMSNLTAGNYGVTINDAIGCSATADITISQPDSLIATIQAINNACSLDSAAINVSVIGGTPDYVYAWGTGEQTSAISSLAEGMYVITVVDAAGCSVSSSFNVVQPAPISVTIVSSNTTCSLLYGTATTNVTGGHENFSFVWNTGETTPSITNLSAGNYVVTVTDALGCSSSNFISFSQPDSMNVFIAASNAANSLVYGKAVAKVTGGAPQYAYLWNTGDTTEVITYATPGTYAVTITDSKGCKQTATTEITEPGTTGVGQVNGNMAFEVYPNPATNAVTVSLDGAGNGNTIMEIRNMLGQTLRTENISATQTQVDVSNLANGVYLFALTQGQQTSVKEIVVKK